MSDHPPNQKDRSLQKALTNKIIDEYFDHCESWLRAILRMCIFSMTQLDRQPALLIQCPNQAVAKRLSRKTWPLQEVVQYLTVSYPKSRRVLIFYREDTQVACRCFDTDTNDWRIWKNSHTPITPAEN